MKIQIEEADLRSVLEAFGEIEWSNNSQWQSDRAKVAITAIKEALAQSRGDDEQTVQQQCMEHGECFGGECIYPAPQPAQQPEPVALDPKDVRVEAATKQMGGFAPVMTNGIRLTHEPTGTVVEETAERSAHRNRDVAWKRLTQLVTSPQPAQQEPVAKVCHAFVNRIVWNPDLAEPLPEGTKLYTSPQPASKPCKVWDAEGYDALCQELEGWKARALKAEQPAQQPVAVTYKEVWGAMNALYAGDIKQVQIALEMENKKLYTSPQPAQPSQSRSDVKPLTDEQILNLVPGLQDCLCDPYDCDDSGDYYASIPKDMIRLARAIEAHHGIKENA